MQEKLQKVKTLLDTLPYIKKHSGKIFVIKYGGSAQVDKKLKDKFARDIILMYLVGIRPIIVHGGGKSISKTLDKMNIKSDFIDGLRITSKEVLEVVEMVLCGNINNEITTLLNMHGAKAIGVNGKDSNFVIAKSLNQEKYGYVGEVTKINPSFIKELLEDKFIPVIAPIAACEKSGHPGFNVNADTIAAHIAIGVKANKIIFMTDTPGVMDKNNELIATLTNGEIERLKKENIINKGMVPKVNGCLNAVKNGVKKAHIIDGRIEHSLLLEIFTSSGVGTVIKNKNKG